MWQILSSDYDTPGTDDASTLLETGATLTTPGSLRWMPVSEEQSPSVAR